MSIKLYIDELNRVRTEIKLNNTKNKELRKRITELELNISDYLKSKGQDGLKYNGQAILIEQKEKCKVKPKKIKQALKMKLESK